MVCRNTDLRSSRFPISRLGPLALIHLTVLYFMLVVLTPKFKIPCPADRQALIRATSYTHNERDGRPLVTIAF